MSFTVDSDWGSGYQGSISILNNNPYAIYNWKMTATFNDNFTWGPDAVVTRDGANVTLTPQSWNQAGLGFRLLGLGPARAALLVVVALAPLLALCVPSLALLSLLVHATRASGFTHNMAEPPGLPPSLQHRSSEADHPTLPPPPPPDPAHLPTSQEILAGATLVLTFGSNQQKPYNFAFTQLLPLLDPDNDPSLATRGQFGAKVFAPYVDTSLYPTPQLVAGPYNATGQLFYTLAFITSQSVAGGTAQPAWGGVITLESQFFYDQIRALRLLGGDVIVSFGGASGVELAQAITDVGTLVAAYQSVIDLYKLAWIDFDVEARICCGVGGPGTRSRCC